jgi:hypothetical protein
LSAPNPEARHQLDTGSLLQGYTFTRKLDKCGCPAITDGLDEFWPTPDNPGSGAGNEIRSASQAVHDSFSNLIENR